MINKAPHFLKYMERKVQNNKFHQKPCQALFSISPKNLYHDTKHTKIDTIFLIFMYRHVLSNMKKALF